MSSDDERGEGPSRRRQRVNENGDARSSRAPTEDPENPNENEEEDPEAFPERREPAPKTQPRDVDGFIPGSIVRIQLRNFVTYDFVEFRPGPYLNMIVGPNGTGKSSIACAIALGLNFPPKVLGRASDLNAFVKHGAHDGHIEIELKGPAGKPNLVIKRTLTSQNKKSSFFLNGSPALGNDVSEKMRELNVQVENLCSFLPQDKVSSFAHMTPQQLLVETQKAAGDASLSTWFETLKVEGKQHKIATQKLKEDEDNVNQMKERNKGIEEDVERFKERQKIEREIAILQVLIPLTEWRELREAYILAKAAQAKARNRMNRLKATNEPAHELLKNLEKEVKKASERREKQKKILSAKSQTLKRKQEESDALDKQSEDVLNELEGLKKSEKDRAKGIKEKQSMIEGIEADLAKPPPNLPDQAALNDEQKQLNLEKSGLMSENEDLSARMREVVQRKVAAQGHVEGAQKSLKALDTTDSRKLNLLRQWDQNAHDAVLWLRANRDLFEQEVFEPPILSVTVTNQQYIQQVEAGFPGDRMKMFVAQTKKDLDTFNHYVNDTTKALGKNVRVATWWRNPVPESVGGPPLNAQQMQEVGFDGYLHDYIAYPPGMEYYVKKELRLHQIAVARNSSKVNVSKAMEYYGNVGGGAFINGTIYNNVTRSRYGRKAIGNMTREIGKPRNFVVPSIDVNEKARLEAIIQENQPLVDMADEEKKAIQDQLNDVQARDKDLRQRMDRVKARREAIQREADRVQGLKARLNRTKAELQRLKNLPSADEQRARLKQKLSKIAKQRIELAREYTAIAESIYKEVTECTLAGLQFVQAKANHTALSALCVQKDEKYHRAVAVFNEAHEKYNNLRVTQRNKGDEAKQRHAMLDPALAEELSALETKRGDYDAAYKEWQKNGGDPPDKEGVELRSSNELAEELQNNITNLECITNTNPGVLEEYEKRKRDIEQRERTIEQTRKTIAKSEKKIKRYKDMWLPALKELVDSIGTRFSAAFDRIGCAGEIRIKEDEDFEQWAIEIYVKFRDTEKLQLLTGQRQSGGERSLTTILYLMSLTEEARAPFSLVDEINQGMDQRAERVVHNSMVDVTCKEDSAQYFLITPKLLTDLNYHERMKILCVNNGEWLPEEKGLGNMMNMIEGFVQRNKPARGTRSA